MSEMKAPNGRWRLRVLLGALTLSAAAVVAAVRSDPGPQPSESGASPAQVSPTRRPGRVRRGGMLLASVRTTLCRLRKLGERHGVDKDFDGRRQRIGGCESYVVTPGGNASERLSILEGRGSTV